MSKKNGAQKNRRRINRGLKPKHTFFCVDGSYQKQSADSAISELLCVKKQGGKGNA